MTYDLAPSLLYSKSAAHISEGRGTLSEENLMKTSTLIWALFASAFLIMTTTGCELGPAPDGTTYDDHQSPLSVGADAGSTDTTASPMTSVGFSVSPNQAGKCRCNPKPSSNQNWTIVPSKTNCRQCTTSAECSLASCTYVNSSGSEQDVGCRYKSGGFSAISATSATDAEGGAIKAIFRKAGGTYLGPGDTVPPWLNDGDGGGPFNMECEDNPLLTHFQSVCDYQGNCMFNVYLWLSVGQAILNGSTTINQELISESGLMKNFALGYGMPGYPRDTCKNLWNVPSWMFWGKGAKPVQCMAINWNGPGVSYLDMHADVCSTTALFDGSP